MSNQWLSHVAAYRQANPTVSYKDCLKSAKATYKQPVVETPPPAPVKPEKKKVVETLPPDPVVEVPVQKVKAKKLNQI